ncbi:MAG: glycosyltransferase family 2 protein [Acetobacterium sp.]|nr:glycosyltransferase family 2 protein [Acetobacterium sp.]
MMEKQTISMVIPCYCEEEVIPLFYDTLVNEVISQMPTVDFEILFIDDGSKDKTLTIIKDLNKKDRRIKYIFFSRNFGKEAAIYAGLKYASGNYVGIMDVDLQDPPALIMPMYEALINEDVDCVAACRESRAKESHIRSFFAKRFYKLINRMTGMEIVEGARDFRLMKRFVVEAVLSVGEYNRFSKGIFEWVGFNTKWLPYQDAKRAAGKTKWSFWELCLYSMEGIIGFSTAPLAFASATGLLFCMLSFVAIVVIIIREILWHGSAYGWASLVCLIFLISGIQLFSIGILGQYLAKTYLETKKRPIFIVKERN